MPSRTALFLILTALVPACAQSPSSAPPAQPLPSDPKAILDAAAPFYNFSDAALKPWHFKANYQLYDENGQPTQQGTYEYWWASPSVYQSTFTRPGLVRTDWHTPDGKHAYVSSGPALDYFEFELQRALLSPLPEPKLIDPEHARLDLESVKAGSAKLPCVMVVPKMGQHDQMQNVPLGLFPTYCFDPNMPVLRLSYSFGTVAIEFDQIAKFQNHYLAKGIELFEGKRKLLTASIEQINGIAASDPALTPSPDAVQVSHQKVQIAAGIAVGMLIKKQAPVYPQDAKDARVSGTVVLQATIGHDGGIHELHIVQSPSPSLAASAMNAVSHWQYRPYLLNGEPVEVETTINVIYSLSQ